MKLGLETRDQDNRHETKTWDMFLEFSLPEHAMMSQHFLERGIRESGAFGKGKGKCIYIARFL